MLKINPLFLLIAFVLVSCGGDRPDGKEVQEFLELVNQVSKPLPKGNHNEYYSLLSDEFISSFENEIEQAKRLDSVALRKLPKMEMLRILSLKNAFAEMVMEADSKTIIINWLGAAGKGFPLQNADRFYYTPKKSLETKMLNEGATFPQVLVSKDGDRYKVNPFNSEEYQEKRMDVLLEKHDLDDLIKDAAWMYIQTQRTVNWDPLQ